MIIVHHLETTNTSGKKYKILARNRGALKKDFFSTQSLEGSGAEMVQEADFFDIFCKYV